MYGDFFLLEQNGKPARRASKLPVGDTRGRNEAWLRDTLFAHPHILPISDIDPAFGPLLPLCREVRTEAGPLDIAYINPNGHLTLVECKLWRNPEARRKVVAQVLDYARAISKWSYADLQRQVSIATGKQGNIPFELARSVNPDLVEHHFADAVVRTLRAGRFLLLIAGDGIREDVGALADLINRNAASGFALGLVEVALYDLGDEGLAVQPRVIARTHVLERTVFVVREGDELRALDAESDAVSPGTVRSDQSTSSSAEPGQENPKQAEYRKWWAPVIAMSFDDPEQEPPKLYWPNNVRAPLPWPRTWVTAYRSTVTCGVFLSGREDELRELWTRIEPALDEIMSELPEGTLLRGPDDPSSNSISIITTRSIRSFSNDDAKRQWLMTTLNQYVNAFRPRMKRLLDEQ